MEIVQQLSAYPLCNHFLSGYLGKRTSPENFGSADVVGVLHRHETLFASALQALGLQKEELRRRPEFNFDSGDRTNLESGIAVLRVVVFLDQKNFLHISLVKAGSTTGADITCERNGQRVCCEVKAITKQSSGRSGLFLEDQMCEKARESIAKARSQLQASAAALQCSVTLVFFVMNWLEHAVVLVQSDYQDCVNRLEQDQELTGIDGVVFITAAGQDFGFLSEHGKCIELVTAKRRDLSTLRVVGQDQVRSAFQNRRRGF
jgi:hypothetical protein